MNRSDSLDFLIMKAIPYVKDTDLEIYLSANPHLTLSEKEKEKILKRAEKEKRYSDSHKKYRPVYEAIRRVAVVVLIVTSILFASAMSVKAVREAVWEIIVGWYEEYIRLDFTKDASITENKTNTALEFEYKEPSLNEGYERYVISQKPNRFFVEYEKGEILICYSQTLLDGHNITITNNDTTVTEIIINNYNGYAFYYKRDNMEQNEIMWEDNTYIYSLSANLPLDELKAIAKTIE